MPLGMQVDLGPGHIVLGGDPALPEKVTAAPLLWAHVYCGQTVAVSATAEHLFLLVLCVLFLVQCGRLRWLSYSF